MFPVLGCLNCENMQLLKQAKDVLVGTLTFPSFKEKFREKMDWQHVIFLCVFRAQSNEVIGNLCIDSSALCIKLLIE